MALTNIAISKATPTDKLQKLSDGDGLQLHITPQGSKLWRLAYRWQGKQKTLALGSYPLISLAQAREMRAEAKKKLANGIDPGQEKKDIKLARQVSQANSFESVAREWHKQWMPARNLRYAESVMSRLEADVFPEIGSKPIADIKTLDLVAMTKKIEARGVSDVAKRNFRVCAMVFRFGVINGLLSRNPAAEVKTTDFMKSYEKKNFARISKEQLPDYLTKVDAYPGGSLVRLAMKLMNLTFLRTSEFIGAKWTGIDFDNARWNVPGERMKVKVHGHHVVPLSRQAIETLRWMECNIATTQFKWAQLQTMNAKTQYKISPSDLEVVLALSRTGTLAMAGERLGQDASTVFRSLQRIEKGLGQRLFERSRQGYQMSELAQDLAAEAEQMEVHLEAARSLIQTRPEHVSGSVRITTTDTILHALVAPALRTLQKQHPLLSFDLHSGNEIASLTRRDADIAVRATRRPPNHLVGKHVGPIRVAVYAARGSSIRKFDESSAKDYCWIAPDDALPEHPSVVWRKKHFPKVMPTYRVNSILTVAELVQKDFGVGVIPLFLAEAHPQLRRISEVLDECQTELWLLTHTESRHLRRVSAVFTHLTQTLVLN